MQTPLTSPHPDLLVQRALAAGTLLLPSPRTAADDRVLAVPVGDLPIWPAEWQRVPGSLATFADERFVAYTTSGGAIATVHSTAGPEPAPSGRLIALVGLGGHRVSVMEAGESRFLARWARGSITHQVTVGPITLAAFMELVLNVSWPA